VELLDLTLLVGWAEENSTKGFEFLTTAIADGFDSHLFALLKEG
jgi:hypothetical protein